jgi:hypothetical protein
MPDGLGKEITKSIGEAFDKSGEIIQGKNIKNEVKNEAKNKAINKLKSKKREGEFAKKEKGRALTNKKGINISK